MDSKREGIIRYKTPGTNNQFRQDNCVFINIGNTVKHELSKCVGSIQVRNSGDVLFDYALDTALTNLAKEIERTLTKLPKYRSSFVTEAVCPDDPNRIIDLINKDNKDYFEFEKNHSIRKKGAITIYI